MSEIVFFICISLSMVSDCGCSAARFKHYIKPEHSSQQRRRRKKTGHTRECAQKIENSGVDFYGRIAVLIVGRASGIALDFT